MTLPYADIHSKPPLLMTPTERWFDWCFTQAVYSRVWQYMIWPVRTALDKHPRRIVRAIAVVSPYILFPYTVCAFGAATVLRITLMLVGIVILGAGFLVSAPGKVKTRISKWYNSL